MKGFIFDMDGVIMDSGTFWRDLTTDFFDIREVRYDKEDVLAVRTMTFAETEEYMTTKYRSDKKVVSAFQELAELLIKKYGEDFHLKEGVFETLELLKSKGYPLALGTQTDEHLARLATDRFKLTDFFDFIQTPDNSGVSKNTVEFFVKLKERIGTPEVWMFEDSFFAATNAKKAGLKTIGVFDEGNSHEKEKLKDITDHFIYSLKEVTEDMIENL